MQGASGTFDGEVRADGAVWHGNVFGGYPFLMRADGKRSVTYFDVNRYGPDPMSTAPTISGFWPGSTPPQIIFVFGTHFMPNKTQVSVGGVPATVIQVLDETLLFFVAPSPTASGLITVTTPSGTATSSSPFGVPLIGLAVTGFWPAQGPVGSFVFVFGHDFVPLQTQVSLNGVNAPIAHVADGGLLFFVVPVGATSGPIKVTTPNGSVTTGGNFTVTP